MTIIEDRESSRPAGGRARRSDAELAAAAADGDAVAFDLLFDRHRATVERAAAQILGDRSEAQDAVQLTFLKIWRAVERFDVSRPFGPWARTIARRVAIDLSRNRGRRDQLEPLLAEDERSAESTFALAARRLDVRRAVARLPEAEQEVVVLTFFGELTHQEAAAWLSIPVGTVKSRSHRAQRALRAALADL